MKILRIGVALVLGFTGLTFTGTTAAYVVHDTVVEIGTKVFDNIYECGREYTWSSCLAAERQAKAENATDIRTPHK